MNPATRDNRKKIRVIIAEDQGMVLGALAALLEIEGDISVIAQCKDGAEALKAVMGERPDVFITDIEMPKMTGLDVAAELRRQKIGTRVIILTTFARSGYLRRAMDAGASGYLLKDMKAEELADAVRRVNQGLRVIDPELATEAWAEPDPLTDRERQVLRLAGDGSASADIALELNLSEVQYGIICRKRSASWERATEWRQHVLPAPRVGCEARSDGAGSWTSPSQLLRSVLNAENGCGAIHLLVVLARY